MDTTYEKNDQSSLKVITTTQNEVIYTKESLLQQKVMLIDRIADCKTEIAKLDDLLAKMEEQGIKTQAEFDAEKINIVKE